MGYANTVSYGLWSTHSDGPVREWWPSVAPVCVMCPDNILQCLDLGFAGDCVL